MLGALHVSLHSIGSDSRHHPDQAYGSAAPPRNQAGLQVAPVHRARHKAVQVHPRGSRQPVLVPGYPRNQERLPRSVHQHQFHQRSLGTNQPPHHSPMARYLYSHSALLDNNHRSRWRTNTSTDLLRSTLAPPLRFLGRVAKILEQGHQLVNQHLGVERAIFA
jgi:hypothetical protein